MRVDLNAKVHTRQGEGAGSVERVVLDPQTQTVTHFVLGTGGPLGRNVLVPRDEIERATLDGGTLRVDLSREDLERLPTFRDADYVSPPAGSAPPVGLTYPYGGVLWPMGPVPGTTYPVRAYPFRVPVSTSAGYATEDVGAPPAGLAAPDAGAARERPNQRALGRGAIVLDRNGDDVGVVDDVRFDRTTGELRGFVLRVGGMLRTLFGGGESVAIDPQDIDRIDTELIHLSIEKEALKRVARAQPTH